MNTPRQLTLSTETDTRSNAPETTNLTTEEDKVFEDARVAANTIKDCAIKTFEAWIEVIGPAVVLAREIANRQTGRSNIFMRVIEQQALGDILDKSTASRLEKIMAKLPEVLAWRETLTEKQKIAWSAPTTIVKHCLALKRRSPDTPSPMALLRQEKDDLKQENIKLQEALHEREKSLQQGLDKSARWQAADKASDIASAILGTLPPAKAKQVAQQILTILGSRQPASTKSRRGRH